jgi:hypothetical protein
MAILECIEASIIVDIKKLSKGYMVKKDKRVEN